MSTASADADASRLRALLLLLCGALGLVVAGNSALAIALPDIAQDLAATQTELTWVIDAYALTFAALLLPAGIAADRFGRRSTLVVGLVIFGVAGAASAFATDPAWLITLRALAGVGAAGVFPVTLSALVDAYPEHRRGFAVAVWSGVSAAGAVLGTLVAGGLLELFWWGSVQLAFGATALLVMPGVLLLVAQNRNPDLSLDPWGATWSVLALTALVYGVIDAPEQGWTAPSTLIALAVAALAGLAFVRHELHTNEPSLDVRAFRNPALTAGALLVALQFFASLALFVLAPQYLQIVRDHSPLQAAATLLVIPLGVGAGTALAPAALARVGARWPGAAGPLALAVGFAALAAPLPRGCCSSRASPQTPPPPQPSPNSARSPHPDWPPPRKASPRGAGLAAGLLADGAQAHAVPKRLGVAAAALPETGLPAAAAPPGRPVQRGLAGRRHPGHPDAGEVIFADVAEQANARRWTNRQSGASAVGAATTNVLIVTEALHDTASHDIRALQATLATAIDAAWAVTPAFTVLRQPAPSFTYTPVPPSSS